MRRIGIFLRYDFLERLSFVCFFALLSFLSGFCAICREIDRRLSFMLCWEYSADCTAHS